MVRIMKKFSCVLLCFALVMSICGCAKQNSEEKETEYKNEMMNYAEEKYKKVFLIDEVIFSEAGFNTGMEQNVLVLKDSDGVTFNVTASHKNPDSFYDDYVEAVCAEKFSKEINTEQIKDYAEFKFYVMLNNDSDFTYSEENIKSLTFMVNIKGDPNEDILKDLYDVYSEISNKNIENVFILIGFTDGSPIFSKAVNNYKVYGEAEWEDFSATVYSYLDVFENNLSFEEFKNALVEI